MQMVLTPSELRKKRSTFSLVIRWLLLLCLSVFLHWLLIEWGTDALISQSRTSPNLSKIEATLIAAPPPTVAEPVPPKPKKPPHTVKPAAKPASNIRKSVDENLPTSVPSRAEARTINAADMAAARASVADLENSGVASIPNTSDNDRADVHADVIDLPPSADLEYDVQKTAKNDETLYGHGTIKWKNDGSRYRIDGDAGVLFFTVLTFNSSGEINDDGIVPDLYREKRFRKAETNTNFQAKHNSIHFSANASNVPRVGIEQDRISVIWQLAGIGRGGSDRFSAGNEIDLLVAGTKKVSMWRMQIISQQDIEVNGETVSTWHITRIPKLGAREQKLDLWLAPQKNWHPVRLRYTEDNGDFLDMSLNKLTPAKISSMALQD